MPSRTAVSTGAAMPRRITLCALATALIATAAMTPLTVRAADPVLMFLLGFARNLLESHAMRPRAPEAPPPVPDTYPGTTVEPALLQRLIDDCFLYLSERQRREIFASLHESLMNPKNAAMRAPMIEYFATRALSVRAMQLRLAQLTDRDKRVLVNEFSKETQGLADDERTQLAGLLRDGLLPVPSDLGAMLLASLDDKPR